MPPVIGVIVPFTLPPRNIITENNPVVKNANKRIPDIEKIADIVPAILMNTIFNARPPLRPRIVIHKSKIKKATSLPSGMTFCRLKPAMTFKTKSFHIHSCSQVKYGKKIVLY